MGEEGNGNGKSPYYRTPDNIIVNKLLDDETAGALVSAVVEGVGEKGELAERISQDLLHWAEKAVLHIQVVESIKRGLFHVVAFNGKTGPTLKVTAKGKEVFGGGNAENPGQ